MLQVAKWLDFPEHTYWKTCFDNTDNIHVCWPILTYILTDVDVIRADILGWSVCMYVPSNKMNRLSWTYILETLFWLLGSSVSMYVTSNKMTRLPRAYILKNIVFLVFLVCYGFSRLYVSPWREMKLLWKILSSHVEHTRTLTNIPGRCTYARVVAKWLNFPNIQARKHIRFLLIFYMTGLSVSMYARVGQLVCMLGF